MMIGVDPGSPSGDGCVVCQLARDADGVMKLVTVHELRRRSVCTRRARKLRRRGIRIQRIGATVNGKVRYAYFAAVGADRFMRAWAARL